MRNLIALLLLFGSLHSFGNSTRDSLISELTKELGNKALYDRANEKGIQKLKKALREEARNDPARQYDLCARIYDEYKSFQFDSAYVYALKLNSLSVMVAGRSKRYDSKIKKGFILLSSGMFRETFESVKEINASVLSDSLKIEYYSLLTRANYDLSDYDNDNYYAPGYNKLANGYIDTAITLSKPGSYERIYLSGYKKMKNRQYEEALQDFRTLTDKHKLSEHQYAIVYSTMSNIYSETGRAEQSIDLLIRAAISDIRSSTKEAVALFWLSELLYKKGDVKNTYVFLQHAMDDAEFYGARQRKFQISALLPVVAAQRMNFIEQEKSRFLTYLFSIMALALLIVLFSVMLVKQLKNLKAKEKIIEDTNVKLARINERLMEHTRIKEEYIGYFFNVISGYILKLEKLKRSVDMKLSVKRFDDIGIIINNINIKKEREVLFNTFDHIFLKIFPHFIEEFNSLFRKEDQIWPKEHEVLSTDLRIFALIRMGIDDNETIAKILEYSEKTIYVYKMRVKAKAIIGGEEFDHRIMAIKAVEMEA